MATKLQNRTVWTIGHRPFVMGGSVHYPLGAIVPCDGPHDLGQGYKGYVVTAPNGKTFIAEAQTGAFVGPDLASVRKDIAEADPKVMKNQVEAAAKQVEKIEIKSADFFWDALKANIKELDRKFFKDRGYEVLPTGMGCKAWALTHVDSKVEQQILITGVEEHEAVLPPPNGPWGIGFYPDGTGNPSVNKILKTPAEVIALLNELEPRLQQKGIEHNARAINKAIIANMNAQGKGVYYTGPHTKNPARLYDARTRKGKLEVRFLSTGVWVPVVDSDLIETR